MPVPGFGHSLDEALLVEWVVGVGDRVRRGDVVAVVETDKASTEILAERDGRVVEHSATAGTILTSGEVLYRLAADRPSHASQPSVPADERERTSMSEMEERISDVMLAKLREREPSSGPQDLTRPVAELDLDSLDLVELHQRLERELHVKGDLRETAGFPLLSDFSVYFMKLASGR
ncbi:biotin/lipoyl-containing protein [Streptomyces sp. NRRL S-920]|uniref:biotin/lipoyl-containing protein n=1 Tax=Streptomyces sp. NRRL S-920 TaxID=1463921 RepID=UPI001F3B40F9|nr:biotin/lipoyl-containing protein [Streptomyces sp. NRRL S-920]